MRFSAFTLAAFTLAASSPALAQPQPIGPAGQCCCCNPGRSAAEAKIVCSASQPGGCFCVAVVCPAEAKTILTGRKERKTDRDKDGAQLPRLAIR
ncbi:hypothetical protein CP533_2904 [Ophiocordyceps camponoti-saundersi (nom. inval.)]|nr:hypothetical protein CP533_2904 [Ophiocordyceps camponoti-saundersi (nom. inval.)]